MIKKRHFIYIRSLTCLLFLLLCACEDRYRYHCQDPKNWEQEDCKPPYCVAAQNCPEYFNKPKNGTAQNP